MIVGLFVMAMLQTTGISGSVRAGVDAPASAGSVVWLPADEAEAAVNHACELTSPTRWACPTIRAGTRGVVLITFENGVGYIVVGPAGVLLTGTASWGRLVRVLSGGAGNRVDLRGSAWVVDRPPSRPNTQRLDAVPDDSVDVLRISDGTFWVSGRPAVRDAFLQIEGGGIARQDTRMSTIAESPADAAFVIQSSAAAAITGRVETRSGEPVHGALVELFARTPGTPGTNGERVDGRAPGKEPVIRLASASSDTEGRFEFSGLADGAYEVAATSFALGRLSRWTRTTDAPLLMRLVPPTNVTGRVVRHRLPVPDVRVRFVPDSTAWRTSSDPRSHLAPEAVTDAGGRFTLALPREAAGTGDVQFIAPDGASVRKSLPNAPNLAEIALGDVALSELIPVEIRGDVPDCRITAVGPIGALGVAMVEGRSRSIVYQFDLPEAGEWFLDAECAGKHASLQPPVIRIRDGGPSSFDVHVEISD